MRGDLDEQQRRVYGDMVMGAFILGVVVALAVAAWATLRAAFVG